MIDRIYTYAANNYIVIQSTCIFKCNNACHFMCEEFYFKAFSYSMHNDIFLTFELLRMAPFLLSL